MNKSDAYIFALVKAVFEDYPYDSERAKATFEKIKSQTNIKTGDNHGYQ